MYSCDTLAMSSPTISDTLVGLVALLGFDSSVLHQTHHSLVGQHAFTPTDVTESFTIDDVEQASEVLYKQMRRDKQHEYIKRIRKLREWHQWATYNQNPTITAEVEKNCNEAAELLFGHRVKIAAHGYYQVISTLISPNYKEPPSLSGDARIRATAKHGNTALLKKEYERLCDSQMPLYILPIFKKLKSEIPAIVRYLNTTNDENSNVYIEESVVTGPVWTRMIDGVQAILKLNHTSTGDHDRDTIDIPRGDASELDNVLRYYTLSRHEKTHDDVIGVLSEYHAKLKHSLGVEGGFDLFGALGIGLVVRAMIPRESYINEFKDKPGYFIKTGTHVFMSPPIANQDYGPAKFHDNGDYIEGVGVDRTFLDGIVNAVSYIWDVFKCTNAEELEYNLNRNVESMVQGYLEYNGYVNALESLRENTESSRRAISARLHDVVHQTKAYIIKAEMCIRTMADDYSKLSNNDRLYTVVSTSKSIIHKLGRASNKLRKYNENELLLRQSLQGLTACSEHMTSNLKKLLDITRGTRGETLMHWKGTPTERGVLNKHTKKLKKQCNEMAVIVGHISRSQNQLRRDYEELQVYEQQLLFLQEDIKRVAGWNHSAIELNDYYYCAPSYDEDATCAAPISWSQYLSQWIQDSGVSPWYNSAVDVLTQHFGSILATTASLGSMIYTYRSNRSHTKATEETISDTQLDPLQIEQKYTTQQTSSAAASVDTEPMSTLRQLQDIVFHGFNSHACDLPQISERNAHLVSYMEDRHLSPDKRFIERLSKRVVQRGDNFNENDLRAFITDSADIPETELHRLTRRLMLFYT